MGGLSFGIVPHVNDDATRTHLADLCRWVSDEARIEIRGHRFPSPSLLASAFGNKKIALAWVSPGLLVLSPHLAGAVPLVSAVREGSAEYHSILYAAASSGLRDLPDLRGARAAWVAPTSAAGYAYPRLELRARGMPPERLFAQESFFGAYGAVVEAIATGVADVGASFATFDGGDPARSVRGAAYLEVASAPAMRILLTAGPIVADPIVASTQVPYADRVRVRDAFIRTASAAAASSAVRALFDAEGFAAADPDRFDAIRQRLQVP